MTILAAPRAPKHTSAQLGELLTRPPFVRGFWTDDELLADSGITSVAVLKKLCTARWLAPDYGPVAEGGRRRVWTFREVVRASVVAEVSARSSIPLIAVGMLLARAGLSWVDGAINLDVRIDSLTAGPLALLAQPSQIVLLDGSEAWQETKSDTFRMFSPAIVLNGAAMSVPPMKAEIVRTAADLFQRGVSRQVLDLAKLDLRVFGRTSERLGLLKAMTAER